MEILDTAGQDEYTPLRETFMPSGDGFLLVYSIVDDQTLEELRGIREQILRVHKDRKVIHTEVVFKISINCFEQVPMVVIGNKVDMAKTDRAVSKEEGKSLADEFGASFLEVSAKDNSKIKDAFETLVKKIIAKNPKAGHAEANVAGGVFGGGKAEE